MTELPTISPHDTVRMLRHWNDTTVDFPEMPLPAQLRRAAQRAGDAIALRDASDELTYTELVARVHQLARYLWERGASNARVASFVPRGIPGVLAQAAVFAAGGTYVPLSAEYPVKLVRRTLAATGVRVVLAEQAHQVIISGLAGTDVDLVILDDPGTRSAIARQSADPMPADPAMDDLAYVIHTSGSSGPPKPVAVSHRAITNSTQARNFRYATAVTDFALVSPLTFDSSLAGIWWSLTTGATLRILPNDPAGLIDELARALRAGSVSHTLLTPSLYQTVLSTVDSFSPHLRQVIVAGEPCPPELVAEHYRRVPRVELVNEYGPTEAAVWCSSATLRPDDDVVVGTPVANTQIWVLDVDGRVLPPGRFGEVCVAGTGLAAGYLDDPELTGSRFVPHPLEPDRLVYRTGDLGRWRSDGQVEIRGRIDHQVKIRGIRVEPDGVAGTLAGHPGVRQAAVVPRATPPSGLVAYLVPEWEAASTADELRGAWTAVVDDLAGTAAAPIEEPDDFSGWVSSYTGRPLPADDMTEWVERTVDLLRETAPRSVLDLGCGTGLLLTRLAPDCDRYVGLDVSRPVLDALAARVERAGLSQVELRHRDAREVVNLAGQAFDLVVCNSVAQYFPDPRYLTDVLRGALRAIGPSGSVVLGDVRDLVLQDAFHAGIVLAQADGDEPVGLLRERWRGRIERDNQLLVDPRWFAEVIRVWDEQVDVEVRPRRGVRRNEMNDYRFDALLRRVDGSPPLAVRHWLAWTDDDLDLTRLRGLLGSARESFGVLRVPNRRTAGGCAVRDELVRTGTGAQTAGDAAGLRQLALAAEQRAVDPEELAVLAAAHGWALRMSRAAGWAGGEFDVVFCRPDEADRPVRWTRPEHPAPPRTLVTDPVRHYAVVTATEDLVPDVRRYAADHLAEHERPSVYVVLPELPLTPHGKVDRAALPEPAASRPTLGNPYEPPVTAIEHQVAEVFADLLRVSPVGLHDDFVQLGGDSLLAVRAAVRLGQRFGVDVPTRSVFTMPTVARLAAWLTTEAASRPVARPGGQRTAVVDGRADSAGWVGDRLPFTPSQVLVWMHDLQRGLGVVPGPDCLVAATYRVSGPLDVAALGEAVDALVRRHEALRTALYMQPDEGYQVIGRPLQSVLHTASAPHASAATVLDRLLADHPLEPRSGRVFAADLVSSGEVEHLLSMRIHHMVGDDRSLHLVEEELTQLYREIRDGGESRLTEAPSYRSAVLRAVDPNGQRPPDPADLKYWAEKVNGVKPLELVPHSYLSGTDQPHRTRVRTLLVPPDEAEPFLRAARDARATLYTALYTVLSSVMYADTRDPGTKLFCADAARPTDELDRTVGLFLSALLMCTRFVPGRSLLDSLSAAGDELREALRHDSLPLLALCQQIPELLAVYGQSQAVVFETLGSAAGLDLVDCTVRRSDPFDPEFSGRLCQIPTDLTIVGREEGGAIRLCGLYDEAFAPASYVDSVLARMRQVILASGKDASLALDAAVRPDPWLAALRGWDG